MFGSKDCHRNWTN